MIYPSLQLAFPPERLDMGSSSQPVCRHGDLYTRLWIQERGHQAPRADPWAALVVGNNNAISALVTRLCLCELTNRDTPCVPGCLKIGSPHGPVTKSSRAGPRGAQVAPAAWPECVLGWCSVGDLKLCGHSLLLALRPRVSLSRQRPVWVGGFRLHHSGPRLQGASWSSGSTECEESLGELCSLPWGQRSH